MRCTELIVAAAACTALAAHAQSRAPRPPTSADRLQAAAVESFRQGRFAEAYGRFVALADAGHSRAAQYALWMCEHGSELFGRAWDCHPEQVADWTAAARRAASVHAEGRVP